MNHKSPSLSNLGFVTALQLKNTNTTDTWRLSYEEYKFIFESSSDE